jgi:CHAT domain-containing protein/Flp pilus assembly protein TadD
MESRVEPIDSVFDWNWLVMEQAPRGPLELIGLHGTEEKTFVVGIGLWDDDAWPAMPQIDAFRKKAEEYPAPEKTKEVDRWWGGGATQAQPWHVRSWLWARLGKMRAKRGAWDECYRAYRTAIADAQDPFAKSLLWQEVGELYQKHNEFGNAREAYLKARVIRENLSSQETLILAAVLEDLGDLTSDQGDLGQAEDLLQRSLRICQTLAPGGLLMAEILNYLGGVARQRGQLDKAADLYQRSLSSFQELAPNGIGAAITISNLGALFADRGDFDKATEFLERSLAIKRVVEPGSLSVAATLHSLAAIAATRGDFRKAEVLFERALEIENSFAPGSLTVAHTLSELGEVAKARGDLDLAMDYQERSLDIRQSLAPDSLDMASSLGRIGSIAETRGEFQRARDFQERAFSLRKHLAPDSLDLALGLNNLANLAYRRGDLDLSIRLYQQSIEKLQRMEPDSIDVAGVLNNLGFIVMRAGKLVEAEQLLRQASGIGSRRDPGGKSVATSFGNLGDVALLRGDASQAVSCYQSALKIWRERVPGTTTLAKSLHDLGKAYRLQPHSLGITDELFQQALDALEQQFTRLGGSQSSKVNFRSDHKNFYRDALDVQLELGKTAAAFQTLERSRARSFLEQLAERDTIFTTDISEDLDRERHRLAFRVDRVQRQLGALHSRDDAKRVEALRDELRRLQDEAGELEAKIRRTSPKLAALQYPKPLDLEAVRAALDPGTLLLSYSVGEKKLLLFSLSQEQPLRVDTLPLTEEELREGVRQFLSDIGTGSLSSPARRQSFEALARKLDSILIEPVADRIGTAKRLLILPDGPLHLLPWGALIREALASTERHGRRWQYLAEWKPFSTVLSATLFAELKKDRPRPDQNALARGVALFGDPILPQLAARTHLVDSPDVRVRSAAQRGFEFEPIPFSRSEVGNISALLPEATVYLGREATEEHAKSLPRNTRIVHFATHATLDERFPLNSAVVLSIPEKFEEGKDNGLLQAWEIFEKVRFDADLVVLSACESGLGKEMGGEGLIGLTRAFQYAGARSVLASLWKISDRTTAELMARFYRHWQSGLPKDEALRAAQMELLQGPIRVKDGAGKEVEIDASSPYSWAAFQINGDWQ